MAGGAGHIYDMISRMRNNNNLLNKSGYFKMKEAYRKISKKENLVYRKASTKELLKIRGKVIEQRRNDTIKMILVACISVIVSAALLSLAAHGIMRYFM
ncbi:hypothetical protein JMN32_11865 [Fulvivirga sp. 29W222]|uniref:Uncharacterized protein n=1 Tax=Fulvivirga marina TaxID=2494733 RepID=A0A937FVQ5_9BACT|nr:hypothetical protein [Fulvivirga marina]MBL6447010.1 hypothetical protein [Fulvivirga marina]